MDYSACISPTPKIHKLGKREADILDAKVLQRADYWDNANHLRFFLFTSQDHPS